MDYIATFLPSLPQLNLPFSVLDVIIVVVILFYAYEGYLLGFVGAVVDLLSFILSFILALKIYVYLGVVLVSAFSIPHGFANALGFFMSALLCEIILNLLLRQLAKKLPSLPPGSIQRFFSKTDHLLGILPGMVSAVIILSFLLTVIIALPSSPLLKNTVTTSYLGSHLVSNTAVIEKNLNDIFGGALHETLNFLTVAPESNDTVSLRFTVANPSIDSESEEAMLMMVNKERADRGIRPLTMDESLQVLARDYSEDMLQNGYFSHYNLKGQSPFDRMEEYGIQYLYAGENLAFAPNVELAMQGLMNSPGHRANILNEEYNNIGVGVMDAGIYGKMFTQEFSD